MIRILKESETKREAIFAREDPVGSVEEPVREIIAQVRAKGDEALKRYTKDFDGVDLTSVEVGQGAIDEGFRMADPMLVDILYRASERVAAFHQHQVRNSFLVNEEDGILMGQKIIPLERVGLYVPGGTAAYPSSVIMNCIPAKLVEMGVEVEEREDTLLVRRSGPLQKANVKTMPYPGFPTDMQPQITTVLCLAEGTSLVTESVWNNRYRYVDELKRMGASIQVDDKTAVVEGVDHLTGAPIQACDLRAGAALVIAALAAKGESEISCVQYIERGYEDIIGKLRALGADIRAVEEPDEDVLSTAQIS